MIEIIVLIMMTQNIGKLVQAKGLKAAGYQWATVGLWFGFEVLGAIIGYILVILFFGESELGQCTMYIFALAGALIGGWLGYNRARNAKPAGWANTSKPPINDFAAQKAADQIEALQKQMESDQISAQEFEEKKAAILAQFR